MVLEPHSHTALCAAGKSEDVVRLRGIPCRGTVGFLTLFEAYKYFEVRQHATYTLSSSGPGA